MNFLPDLWIFLNTHVIFILSLPVTVWFVGFCFETGSRCVPRLTWNSTEIAFQGLRLKIFTTTPKLYLLGFFCLGFIVELFTSLSCFSHFLFLHFLGVWEKWKLFLATSRLLVIAHLYRFLPNPKSFVNILLQILLHVYLRVMRSRTIFFLLDLLETCKSPS